MWSKEWPNEDGYYWTKIMEFRDDPEPEVCLVRNGNILYTCGSELSWDKDNRFQPEFTFLFGEKIEWVNTTEQ